MTRIKTLCQFFFIMLVFLGVAVAYCKYFKIWFLEESDLLRFSMVFGIVLMTLPVAYLIFLTVLMKFFYREVAPLTDGRLPRCTVVIPAYNEGEHVYKAIASVFDSDYPADKLEVYAVDDGSIDDTWSWMNEAGKKFGPRLKLLRNQQNKGKRYALYRGFTAGNGEVLISIDSDSMVMPDAIRKMVSPFAGNEKIGAVSGNIRVANLDNGIFPPMIEVGFAFSFEFVRAGQSAANCVLCTPGALSAYRRSAIMPLLNEWLNQSFMGKPAGIGEDRALTNLILRENYDVTLQRSAMATTNVPECYVGICRMLLRWERSNIRENLSMFGFVFKNFDVKSLKSWMLLFSLLEYTQMCMLPGVMILITLYNILMTHGELLGSVALMTIMWATIPALANMRRKSLKMICFCYVYGIFHLLALFWVAPYALVTVGNSRWLTRMVPGASGKL
ncbi:MAG: glycosyltransferase [Lentisphaeria bacterium]|nr:glycosyltransferase [Lentisphaeria bacterium]